MEARGNAMSILLGDGRNTRVVERFALALPFLSVLLLHTLSHALAVALVLALALGVALALVLALVFALDLASGRAGKWRPIPKAIHCIKNMLLVIRLAFVTGFLVRNISCKLYT